MSLDPLPVPDQPDDPQVVTAELVESPATAPRPVWTAVLVCLAAIMVASVISGVVLVVAAMSDSGPEVLGSSERMYDWLRQFGQSRDGLLVLLLPGQLVFLTIAVAASLFSPRPLALRLSLTGGRLPPWTWLVFVLATPVVVLVSSGVVSLVADELSENLKMIEAMLRAHADVRLTGLILLVALLPGVAEELLFRGYLQTRLVERWPPLLAIGVSAIIFSAAHLDPLHALGVLPLGLWLGAVAWCAGSVWPAVLCHAANNTLAVIGLKYQQPETVGIPSDPLPPLAVLLCVAAFLFSLYLFRSGPSGGQRSVATAGP